MTNEELINALKTKGRVLTAASTGDEALGPLKNLPGTWANLPGLPGRGWNMIALPFSEGRFNYRLLLNQYNETLKFSTVDKGVPNRGLEGDQFLAALDYEQSIEQIAAADSPESGLAGEPGLAIHHEPGLWLHIINKRTGNLDVARLATIPHGNSVLALGYSSESTEPPTIPDISGLPTRINDDSLDNPYLAPYKHFNDNPFVGNTGGAAKFNPVIPNELLKEANQGVKFKNVTKLEIDTKIKTGGIVNIPFIVKEADATEMTATFWIQEIVDANGQPKFRLQYTQTVFLDFLPGVGGRIRWPHVSINTLEKVA